MDEDGNMLVDTNTIPQFSHTHSHTHTHNDRCMDEDGEMLVDTNTILQLCTKVAVHTHNAGSSMIFVSV
jgi:hypothetical protein